MDAITLRRALHSHPELSFCEHQSAATIEQALESEGIPHRRVATTGIIATIEGRGDLTRAVVLRADIDALPVKELTELDYTSTNDGVMHACGHDMHAGMLFGALKELNHDRNFEGTIIGVFQPGEECNPGGASLVIKEEPFAAYNIQAVIGQHVDATIEVGEIGLRAGQFMAASDELRFTINGKGGHAARRAELKDPVVAMAEFITALTQFNSDTVVLSIGKVEAPGATNVIPHSVKLEGTLRTFDESERKQIKEQIQTVADKISARHNLAIECDINHGYPSVLNDNALTAIAKEIMESRCKIIPFDRLTTAEDFGFYSQRYPSLFYRLGVGAESGKSHTATFSPSEEAIPLGVELLKALALRILKDEK